MGENREKSRFDLRLLIAEVAAQMALVLAMPISWKGTLQQYAGRLHREHATKTDVRIIDFIDTGHPALLRMWAKRQSGYRAMGYRVAEQPVVNGQTPQALI